MALKSSVIMARGRTWQCFRFTNPLPLPTHTKESISHKCGVRKIPPFFLKYGMRKIPPPHMFL